MVSHAGRERRDALRAREIAQTPSWYNPWLHLAPTSAFGMGAAAIALASIHSLRAWEFSTILMTWVAANPREWRAHRSLLNKRTPLAPVIYDGPTPVHHMIYVTED